MKKVLWTMTALAVLTAGVVNAKPGPYVGLELGYGKLDAPKVDTGGQSFSTTHDSGGLAGRLYAGYLWQQGHFGYGLEMGYAQYSQTENTFDWHGSRHAMSYSGNNIDLMGVGEYNFTSSWRVIGKAGVAYVHQRTDIPFEPLVQTKDKLLPKLALGVGYQVPGSGLSFDLSYSHVFGQDPVAYGDPSANQADQIKIASVDMVTLGIAYHF